MKTRLYPPCIKQLTLAIAIGASLITQAFAQDLTPASPESVGLSEQGIEDLAAGMRKAVDEGNLAGIVSTLIRDGKIVHLDAYGYQDIQDQVPMTEETIFRIFSMTKPVTGVALMMLHEEGKFSLEDPVSQYIPELAGLRVAAADGPDGVPETEPADHEMTIRELMSHTGGLTYGLFSRSQVDSMYQAANILDANGTLKDMIDKLAQIPLRQQPGSLWHYSVSVDVQGYLVEVLSGQTFAEFLQQRLFDPLNMGDTGFAVPDSDRERFATMYQSGQGGLTQPQDALGGDYREPVTFYGGGGGLVSTIGDYMKFTQMLANGGELNGVRVLSPESVALMRSNQLPEGMEEIPGYPGNQFGLDFAVVVDPSRNNGMSEGSYWWWGIGGTWFWIDPVENLTFIGMIQNRNLMYARQLQAISKELVYSAITESNR
ncbi:MAG: serine hydrolase domain-containing protein [Pseudomonadota bacterium]|nr:serine hydrolase [Gammaproteobacteria bacterium]MBJ53806.1 serine hydrolase [Gammaproteobacteria bacterium]MEC8859484.1 serine hydrolase domain-containing protein [Pseudomonadota bacterium]HBN15362.1 serine hydrolase [Pseudohongiella sp.]|tara:strand:+ start:2358 stop:3647 length:1290 start_codon:yes stop_codon:yes gene_type:complete